MPSPSFVLGPKLFFSQSHKVLKGEDTWALHSPVKAGDTDFSLFGVFDGHGKKDAAKFVAKNLLETLQGFLRKEKRGREVETGQAITDITEDEKEECDAQDLLMSCMPEALKKTFLALDDEFREMGVSAGTTATVLAVVGWEVFVANVGDSLAYLDTGSECLRISANHRIDDSVAERERIKSAGGCIAQASINEVGIGPLRVWPGGLAMGRTIGDPLAGDFVIPEPEISQFTLPLTGGRLVLASDGLWDPVNPKTACHHARGQSSSKATRALVKLSAQNAKSTRDDVTVLIVDAVTHSGGKVPICISKTLNTPLARTLSSMNSGSSSNLRTDMHTGVHIFNPFDQAGSGKWKSDLWIRRTEAVEHALRMQEFSGSNRFSLKARSASCPPKRSSKSSIGARVEDFDEWVLVGKPERPEDTEMDWRPHPKHRRAVSDVHCAQEAYTLQTPSSKPRNRTRKVHFSMDADSPDDPPPQDSEQPSNAQIPQTAILAGINASS